MQWIRYCNLFVSGSGGSGLNLSELRVTFEIKKTENETPNHGEIKIYNLATDTEARIINEFTNITLQAGYQDGYGVIFNGQIVQSKRGRDNGTDSYLVIEASDGDVAYNYALVNKTLAAGSTQADHVNAANGSMGLQTGVTETNATALPRGKVMYGSAKDIMRQSAQSNGQNWSIQDGALQILKTSSVLPNQAIVLNSKTGLVGGAEQSTKGVKAKCLLNPNIKVGQKVQINENDVALAKISSKKSNKNPENKPAPLTHDGVYKVIAVEHKGDTRGNDWFTEILCVTLDATIQATAL